MQIRDPLDAGQTSESREAGDRGGMPTKFCSGTARCDNHKQVETSSQAREPVTQCKEFVVIGKIVRVENHQQG